ncbi:hypothetical protein [Aeromonas dhakensis]|uniref:hypothetical protein n=1 Tax=Aeromonas dhakensis TaxID=196024 RepID=UPI003BA01920
MFYHIVIGVTGMTSWIDKNHTREDLLLTYLCPFVCKEITFLYGRIINMSSYGSLRVYKTNKPIDSDWPIKKEVKEGDDDRFMSSFKYDEAVQKEIMRCEISEDITEELFKESIFTIESGRYQEYRTKISLANKSREVFMVCPFGNDEVDHNYEYVIKPLVEKNGLTIHRVDQISHTKTINEKILESINKSLFVIGDLTDSKPNCYYEVGYAHAQGKPVIILAKNGTDRHFDISTYKWNYWNDYKDLKTLFEKELESVLREVRRI